MSGIGEFVPARHRFIPDKLLLLVGFDLDADKVLASDTEGNLEVWSVGELSIDWHYDPGDGRWKPDFEEG